MAMQVNNGQVKRDIPDIKSWLAEMQTLSESILHRRRGEFINVEKLLHESRDELEARGE